MIGMTNTGGGGRPYAFIVVTCPSGSTVSCTTVNGSVKGKKKKDETHWIFYVGSNGTYTLTANDGVRTTNPVSATINSEGQSVSVVLSYSIEVVKNGILQSGFSIVLSTKRYSLGSTSLIETKPSYDDPPLPFKIYYSAGAKQGSAYIKVTGCSSMHTITFTGTIKSTSTATNRCGLFVCSSVDGTYCDSNAIQSHILSANTTESTYTFSLSGTVPDTLYLVFYVAYSDAGKGEVNLTSLTIS